MTHVPSSFVQDGDFGFGVKVRVVTENGTSGLLVRNMLLPSRRISPLNFEANGIVIHAPGFEFTPANVVGKYIVKYIYIYSFNMNGRRTHGLIHYIPYNRGIQWTKTRRFGSNKRQVHHVT